MRKVITGGLADKGMPAFGGTFKPEQVDALIRYVREHQTTEPEPMRTAASPQAGGNSKWE
jgi:mono/diheme cytochrome c family protein